MTPGLLTAWHAQCAGRSGMAVLSIPWLHQHACAHGSCGVAVVIAAYIGTRGSYYVRIQACASSR